MNEELAKHLVKTAFKSGAELTVLYQFLNEYCEDGELKENLKKSLRKIIADIGMEFNRQLTDEYPSIQKEIDDSMEKYGSLIRQ